METTLLVLVIGILCIVCFFIGAKVGQTVSSGKEIKLPDINKLNPIEIYKQHEEKKESDLEKKKVETILRNIERYDGTDVGQEDVPM